jgi:hypothetical protein
VSTSDIESALCAAERSLAAGSGLAGTGFWKAVDAVKRDPALVESYADRISEIDRQAFEAWVLLSVPVAVGTSLLSLGTLAGLGLVGWGYAVDPPVNGLLLLAGSGVVLGSTHGLAHLAVGRAVGMHFTHWFIPSFGQPQPGVKVDYATYLRVPPRKRAWMHAAGAVVGKLIPFLAIPAALTMGAPGWTVVVLVVGGIVQIVTDVLWSTKASDWKKFRREMQYVDSSRSG